MSNKCLPTRTLLYVSFRHIFINLTSFLGDTKPNENIIQDLFPNWIISFLKVYKELTHCFVVFPFFLKCLTNEEYMTSSWPVASKSTLLTPIISSTYGINLDSRMLDKIFYVAGKSNMPLWLLQSFVSPFLYTGKMIESFHSSGNSSLFQVEIISLIRKRSLSCYVVTWEEMLKKARFADLKFFPLWGCIIHTYAYVIFV